jgi:uncharacterized protein (TIGR00251 family)
MAKNQVVLEVHIQPGARSDELVGLRDSILHVRVKAPPRKGQANRALIALLAEALGLSKRDLAIVRGHTSRNKALDVQGISPEELKERLEQLLAGRTPYMSSTINRFQGKKQ